MKKLELEIKNCSGCPYLTYDSHYSMSRDSGYDCKKSHRRVIDDWDYNNTNNPKRLVQDWDNSYPIPSPDWCPLEDKLEFDFGNPMEGKELEILKKTASRLISNKPTTLNKKGETK